MAHAVDDFTPSPQQQALLDEVENGRGSFILEAGPGSGKTFTLVKATERMSGSVFLGAYNSKMGKELRDRTQHLSGVKAGTFHSAGFNALRRAITIKGDPDGKKMLRLCDIFIAEKGRKDLEPLIPTVAATVSMAKQRGIAALPEFPDDPAIWREMIDHFGLADDLPESEDEDSYEKAVEQVIAWSRAMLKRSDTAAREQGLIDFDDMVYLPLRFNLRMWENDWVLVDEAQDTNPTRRALAKKMLKRNGRLVAVGDPRQAIYGFSGADNDALDQIRRDFRAEVLPLTVSYRCPKAVVKVCQTFYPDIEAHESALEGEFREMKYEDVTTEAKPGDAILCRYNKYLVNLCFKFIRAGVPARIEGRAIGENLLALAGKWKVKNLATLVTRVNAWMEREATKALTKGQDVKADQIRDRGETLLVLIERALEQGINDVVGLKTMVASMFDDRVVDRKDMITLCSVHRSKGLEWPRVFVLGLHELMGRECRQQWQTVQEVNLQWVAASRAQELLVDVTGVKEEKKQHTQEETAA